MEKYYVRWLKITGILVILSCCRFYRVAGFFPGVITAFQDLDVGVTFID